MYFRLKNITKSSHFPSELGSIAACLCPNEFFKPGGFLNEHTAHSLELFSYFHRKSCTTERYPAAWWRICKHTRHACRLVASLNAPRQAYPILQLPLSILAYPMPWYEHRSRISMLPTGPRITNGGRTATPPPPQRSGPQLFPRAKRLNNRVQYRVEVWHKHSCGHLSFDTTVTLTSFVDCQVGRISTRPVPYPCIDCGDMEMNSPVGSSKVRLPALVFTS